MGKALEMISAFATAPSAGAAAAAATGNSLTIRSSPARAYLIAAFGNHQADGFARLTSPEMHDSTFGFQQQFEAGITSGGIIVPQELQSQDTLSLTLSGSAVAGDIETAQLHVIYEDLPGINANLIDDRELLSRAESLYSAVVTATSVATGQYGAQVAVNASNDQFKANRQYAILGASVSGTPAALHAIRVIGPDFGNLGVGIPVLSYDPGRMADWFWKLSAMLGMPTIPVLSSPNKALTFVQQIGNENAASAQVMIHYALLGEKRGKGRA